jgi:hypothetical protein
MSVLLAKLLAIGASFAVNFSMSHFVVFRTRPQHKTAPGEHSRYAQSQLADRRKYQKRLCLNRSTINHKALKHIVASLESI